MILLKKVFFLLLISVLIAVHSTQVSFAENDDSFLLEDFEETIPEFVQEKAPEPGIEEEKPFREESEEAVSGFSVRKRTYLTISYGAVTFPGDSELDKILKEENKYFKDILGFQQPPFHAPIVTGQTGGLEVKKGWSDNLMLGLSVQEVVGQSPERKLRDGSKEVIASARFDITTTYINSYLYSPINKNLEYYIGAGVGVGSGVVQLSEDGKHIDLDEEYTQKVPDKASGVQVFVGLDWHFAGPFILETRIFYRGMEFKNVSLTGGGLTMGLGMSF